MILLSIVVGISHVKPPKFLRDVHQIVCMGASITHANDPGHGYVALLRKTLQSLYPEQNIEVTNSGISGQRAPEMLARWDKDVIQKKPDLVTVHVGTNDVWHGFDDQHPKGDGPGGIDLDTYTKDVTAMVETSLAHSIKIVLISPAVIMEDPRSPQNQRLPAYIEAERKIASSHHVPFVDLHKAFTDRLKTLRAGPDDKVLHLTLDGVHMQEAGDDLMAYTILRVMGVPKGEIAELEPTK